MATLPQHSRWSYGWTSWYVRIYGVANSPLKSRRGYPKACENVSSRKVSGCIDLQTQPSTDMHTHAHTYVRTYRQRHPHMHIYGLTCTDMPRHSQTCTSMHTHGHTYTGMPIQPQTCTEMNRYARTYVHVRTHMQRRAQTVTDMHIRAQT